MTTHFDPASYAGIPLEQTRRQVADEIERMISFLDFLDGDCDLEPSIHGDDREPDLAEDFTGTCLEEDDCDLEIDHEGEPSTGWTECVNQDCDKSRFGEGWSTGEYMEPSLGWTNPGFIRIGMQIGNQFLGQNPTDKSVDLEDEHDGREPDDSGIGDMDGLQEQFSGWNGNRPGLVYEGVL